MHTQQHIKVSKINRIQLHQQQQQQQQQQLLQDMVTVSTTYILLIFGPSPVLDPD